MKINGMNSESNLVEFTRLLYSWKLAHLLQHFKAQKIDIETLKMLKAHHIPVILNAFPYGDIIRFEYNLEIWRKAMGLPLQDQQTQFSAPSHYNNLKHETVAAAPTIEQINKSAISAKVLSTVGTQTVVTSVKVLPKPADPPPTPLVYPKLLTKPYDTTDKYGGRHIDLKEILQASKRRGPQLLRNYNVNKGFTTDQRSDLISLIAAYFDSNNIHLSLQMSYDLEKQILSLFPTERLNDYRTEKRGKIYMRVSNIKNYKRKHRKLAKPLTAANKKLKQANDSDPLIPEVTIGEQMDDSNDGDDDNEAAGIGAQQGMGSGLLQLSAGAEQTWDHEKNDYENVFVKQEPTDDYY